MTSVFTGILKGEIPGEIVWQDDNHFALLALDAVNPGHTLVIPKREVDHWLDLDEQEIRDLFTGVYQVGKKLQSTYDCLRVCQMIVGYEVPHVHVHLIPTDSPANVPMPAAKRATPEQLATEAEKICAQA